MIWGEHYTRNKPTWDSMQPGDFILCVYDNTYHYVARVLGKYDNRQFAEAVWGRNESGETWQYMYFLTKPTKINKAASDLGDYLNREYRGFCRIGDEKLAKIRQQYGSVEAFVDAAVLGTQRQRRIFKISPGEGAEWWDECRQRGYIRVGWEEMGDLRQYPSQEKFKNDFKTQYLSSLYKNNASTTSRKAKELWKLLEIRPGDMVLANKGIHAILAVGEVLEPGYKWRPDREGSKHTVRVQWDTSVAKEVQLPDRWRHVTVEEIEQEEYDRIMASGETQPKTGIGELLRANGLHFSDEVLANYLLALQTKRFVILTGISGTGKTRLAKEVAKYLAGQSAGPSESNEEECHSKCYEVIAVRPDWTDNRGLLGYFNPLTQKYSATPFLHLLIHAQEEVKTAEKEKQTPAPFFVILDEMNLARLEHYFSDFLSCLESSDPGSPEHLHLHDHVNTELGEGAGEEPIPMKLAIPDNVYFTGTVNVDETTYMFSPKVLDRAFTIELNQVDLESFGAGAMADSDQSLLRLQEPLESLVPYRKPATEDWIEFGNLLAGELKKLVVELNAFLEEENRHFGYRVANEIARFVNLAAEQAGSEPDTLWAALDLALMEKVLPKFHGTQQELQGVLEKLFAFAVAGKAERPTEDNGLKPAGWQLARGRVERKDADSSRSAVEPKLPRVAAKVFRMLRRLQQQGFTSFIE